MSAQRVIVLSRMLFFIPLVFSTVFLSAQVQDYAWYNITVKHSGMSIGIVNGSIDEDAPMQQWTTNMQRASQQWRFEFADNEFARIRNRHSGKYMTAIKKGVFDPISIVQQSKSSDDNQLFRIIAVDNAYFHIISKVTEGNIGINGASRILGARLQDLGVVARLTNPDHVQFRLNQADFQPQADVWFNIQLQHSNMSLGVYNTSTSDGGRIQQWTTNLDAKSQQWMIEYLPPPYVRIKNRNSEKYLTVNEGNDSFVQQWSKLEQDRQIFSFRHFRDGYFQIVPKHSGGVLGAKNKSTVRGTRIYDQSNPGATPPPEHTLFRFVRPDAPPNIALRKVTQQSSYKGGNEGHSSLAVDGNINGREAAKSVSITREEIGPWWEIDLGDYFKIDKIEIWTADCCREELDDYNIVVDNQVIFYSNQKYWSGRPNPIVHEFNKPFTPKVEGYRIRIYMDGKDAKTLALAEVKVYGEYVAPSTKLTYGGNHTLKSGQITDFLKGVRQQSVDLLAGTKIPLGVSNIERPNPTRYFEKNTGNHIQGLSLFPDGKRFVVNYTQHYTDCQSMILEDESECKETLKTYFDKRKSLVIVGGNGIFNLNRVPSFNSIEPSGISVAGSLMAIGWQHAIKLYRVDESNGNIVEIPSLALEGDYYAPGHPVVGLTDHNDWYYLVTTSTSPTDNYLSLALYRTRNIDNASTWELVDVSKTKVDPTPPDNLAASSGKWETDAVSLVSDGKDLYLVKMHYWKMNLFDDPNLLSAEYSRERVSLDKLSIESIIRTTDRQVKFEKTYDKVKDLLKEEVYRQIGSQLVPNLKVEDLGYVELPRLARTWDKQFFRWGGTAFVNNNGDLEVYNCSRVFAEANMGWLETIKYFSKE